MKTHRTDQDDGSPLNELSPELRRIVEGIVRKSPPDRLAQRILSGIPRPEKATPVDRRQPLGPRRQRRVVRWNVAKATAMGVTACTLVVLAVSVLFWRVPKTLVVPQTPTATAQDLPTAWAYHEAMAESPEAVDSLLARHARQVLCPERASIPACAFPHSLRQMP
jgi:hypothetical protein